MEANDFVDEFQKSEVIKALGKDSNLAEFTETIRLGDNPFGDKSLAAKNDAMVDQIEQLMS